MSKVRLDKIARYRKDSMRAKKTIWDKTAIFLSVWRQKKKTNQRTKLSIYILDTIESESITRFKNRSSDRMMTSHWLVDVSDDRYTTIRSEMKISNRGQMPNLFSLWFFFVHGVLLFLYISQHEVLPLNVMQLHIFYLKINGSNSDYKWASPVSQCSQMYTTTL